MSDRVVLAAETEKVEQRETKETEGTREGEAPAEPSSVIEGAPSMSTQLAERIRQSERLPVGLRTRLAELVMAQDSAAAEAAVRAVEESLPGVLRVSTHQIARPAHPSGAVFFRGDERALSDDEAEAIARGQLARSGMLRGQRVRVGD